jgi:hypothetical protein
MNRELLTDRTGIASANALLSNTAISPASQTIIVTVLAQLGTIAGNS